MNEDSSGTILILKNEIKRLKKEMMEQMAPGMVLNSFCWLYVSETGLAYQSN